MSGFFGSVQYLTSKMGYESMRSASSIKRIAASGDPVKQASLQGQGAGGISFAANLLNGKASKRSSMNAFQNAMTFMQSQAEGLRQAEKIYQQMLNLASLAVDPMMTDDDRALLSQGFESLRNTAVGINSQDLAGADLFDARAATTQYEIDFLEGTTQDPATQNGVINGHAYWDITKDVIYNSGELTIDHRPQGAWDRVTVFQKDPNNPLFDTGEWTTKDRTDFDRFVVRYGPDRDTTFQFIPQDTNNNGTYDNKSKYIAHLELGDDLSPSGWDTRKEIEYTNLGTAPGPEVRTNPSDPTTSELTVRIEATGSAFDVEAKWEPLEMDGAVVGRSQDLQVGLNLLGLGPLHETELDSNDSFPKISIDTLENAQKAIDIITTEIAGFSQQLGNLSSNMSRVEISMDATQKQVATHEQALSGVVREDLAMQMLAITKARIARSQSAALLTQAMNLNYDIVNMLI